MFDRVGKTDPVTRGIEITVNYLGIQFDVCCHCQLTLLYIFWLAKSLLSFPIRLFEDSLFILSLLLLNFCYSLVSVNGVIHYYCSNQNICGQ